MYACRFTFMAFLLVGCSNQPDTAATRKPRAEPFIEMVQSAKVAATGRFLWQGGEGIITELQFSPDDAHLVVSLAPQADKPQRQIVVLRLSNAAEEFRFQSLFPSSICFSPDGLRLAVLAADMLTIHDTGNKEIMTRIDRKSFDSEIRSLGFTADGSVLVGAAEDLDPETDRIAWDATTGETVEIPTDSITWHGRALSQDGRMFFTGGWPGPTPRIIKTDRTERITFCFRDEWPIAAAFTPDSENLVSIHRDGLLVVWEIKPTGNNNARQLGSQAGFDDCRAFAVSHDREWIATSAKDCSIRIRTFPIHDATGG